MNIDSKVSTINLDQIGKEELSDYELLSNSLGYSLIIKYNFINNQSYLLKFKAKSAKKSILQIKIVRNGENVMIDAIPIYQDSQLYESLFYSYFSDRLILEVTAVDGDPNAVISLRNLRIIPMKGLENLGLELDPGTSHFRAYVARPGRYDLNASNQFSLLTQLGLRDYKYVLDIGCGSLNLGRLLIPFLLPARYFGIEPNRWLVEKGVEHNLGNEIIGLKKPSFQYVSDFSFYNFNQEFDFLIAHSIFSHAPPSQIEQCLMEARKVMNEESIFVASFSKGENSFKDYWIYPGLWTYEFDYMKSIISKCGLYCKELKWNHAGVQTWIAITKNPERLQTFDI